MWSALFHIIQCKIEFTDSTEYVDCSDGNPMVEGTEEEEEDAILEDGLPNKRIKLDGEAE